MESPPAKRFCDIGSAEIDTDPEPDLVQASSADNPVAADKVEQNAMLNPVVLKHFFGVCKLEDLRRFRLVCPLWRDVSLERWREEMIVHVAFDIYFERRKNSNKRKRLRWEDASILYQTPSIAAKPFRKFRLCNWQFPEVKPKRDSLYKRQRREILNEFWINCGPWMKELHLKQTKIKSTGTFVETVTEFAQNIVLLDMIKMFEISLAAAIEVLADVKTQLNLKSLKIHFSGQDNSEYYCLQPQVSAATWIRLFATFPNLQELRWMCFDDALCQNLVLAWNRLVEDERHAGRKLKISGYRDIKPTQIGDLNSFLEHPDFAFHHVKIGVKSFAHEGILSRFLENHQNTLKTLDLSTVTSNLTELFRVPRYLTEATLQLDDTPDFHFLKYLPSLKKLVIREYSTSMAVATRTEDMKGVQLEKLSHLDFCYSWNWRLSGVPNYKLAVDIFVKCMPNLTVLKCPLSNEVFRVVCQCWRSLNEIGDNHTLDEILDDNGVTGIVPGEGSRLPNITLLKYLRKFQTTCALTDKSVYDGFLQLEHLTDLDINNNAMSSAAVSALSSKFGSQIFHAYQRNQRSEGRKRRNFFDEDEDLVEERLNVQMLAKDYGIILGHESVYVGDEIGYLSE